MIIGIDPGQTGGVSFLFNNGEVEAYQMPKTRLEYLELIETSIEKERNIRDIPRTPPVRAVIEKVNAMPSQGGRKMGASSAFKFGQNYEIHLSMMTALKIPFELVTAREWQKFLRINKPKDYQEGKLFLLQKAQEIFPDIFYGKTKTYSKAVCDSLLILEYGRKNSVDIFKGL